MYIDSFGLFWDAAALSASAVSTNAIDLSAALPEVGAGEPLQAMISVDVAADATTGDETYEFRILQSANADLSSADVLVTRVISRTLLTLGSLHAIEIPPGSVTKRYIGMGYVGGGTTPTITVTAWLAARSMQSVAPKHYVSGSTIL